MENEKTELQKTKEQIERKMTRAIVKAIKDGAKCELVMGDGLRIDGVYLAPKFGTEHHGLILRVNAPEIEQLFNNRESLERRAEELRAELGEIENKLKSK